MSEKFVNQKIDRLRVQIDDIDEKILDLVNKRLTLAIKIGDLKKCFGKSVMDDTREIKLVSHLISLSGGPLSERSIRQIFYEIISASREIQKIFLRKSKVDTKADD